MKKRPNASSFTISFRICCASCRSAFCLRTPFVAIFDSANIEMGIFLHSLTLSKANSTSDAKALVLM